MSNSVRHTHVDVSGGTLHVAEVGPAEGPPIVFLHGWPQDWSAWLPVMALASVEHRCIAIDLPGIGGSKLTQPTGDKILLAGLIRELFTTLQLDDITLVGHDVGGMITFAYLKQFSDLGRAVIMNTVIPGIAPWERVLANPYLWHFAFHAIPSLPETLVKGRVRPYFDYFYDAISARKEAITEEARNRYVASYQEDSALTQGFEFYRAFCGDAVENARAEWAVETPVLYLRGASEGGDIADYRDGLTLAGLRALTTDLIEGTGHFAPEEAPDRVWTRIAAHLAR